jgi:hypothetical protein
MADNHVPGPLAGRRAGSDQRMVVIGLLRVPGAVTRRLGDQHLVCFADEAPWKPLPSVVIVLTREWRCRV